MIPIQKSLGKAWTYPSDHLPIGITLKDGLHASTGHFSIISWNVLNSMWISYIDHDKDLQGLKESAIVALNKKDNDSGAWTRREHKIVDQVINMLFQRSCIDDSRIICLQECSKDMLKLLSNRIEDIFKYRMLILHTDLKYNDMGVIIYDSHRFKLKNLEVVHGNYSDSDNFIMHAEFEIRKNNHVFQIINTHIPEKEDAKGKEELANYLKKHMSVATTFVLGDMNQPAEKISDTLKTAFLNKDLQFQYWKQHHFTHIDKKKSPVSFDQIHFYKSKIDHYEVSILPLKQIDIEADELVHRTKLYNCQRHAKISKESKVP